MIRVLNAVKWQLRIVFHEIQTPAVFFLIINGLLLLLPTSVCRIIDRRAGVLVILVSTCYALSLFAALFYGMNYMLHTSERHQNELWYLAVPNPWLRIFSRLAAVMAVVALSFLNGQLGTNLMEKFADASHSYFRMEMKGGIPETFTTFSLLLPLLYLFWNLYSGRDHEHKGKAIPLIGTLIVGQMITDCLKGLPAAAGIAAAAAILGFLFWQCGRMEGRRDVL